MQDFYRSFSKSTGKIGELGPELERKDSGNRSRMRRFPTSFWDPGWREPKQGCFQFGKIPAGNPANCGSKTTGVGASELRVIFHFNITVQTGFVKGGGQSQVLISS